MPGNALQLPPIDLDGLPSDEAYTRTLDRWKRASDAQMTALRETDWKKFNAALDYKTRLTKAWATRNVNVLALRGGASDATVRRWDALVESIMATDLELERIMQTLRDKVQKEMQEFGAESRVMRKYHSMPKEFTPSFFDKKY
ncbi:MAG: hypothetical protein O3A46_02565 [Candidatus Poribacteria bacterium]|nr:hypothetical protein [Candidatus Poribacteria bacterium]